MEAGAVIIVVVDSSLQDVPTHLRADAGQPAFVLTGGASVDQMHADVAVVAADGQSDAQKRMPGIRTVVVSPPDEPGAARRALSGGASGVVLAGELATTLSATVRGVAAGQVVVPRSLRPFIDRPLLTPREKQILAMVVLSFSNAEIATRLWVTENTIKSHLTSAFRKLGVRSRKEAAALILDPDEGHGAGILGIPGK